MFLMITLIIYVKSKKILTKHYQILFPLCKYIIYK